MKLKKSRLSEMVYIILVLVLSAALAQQAQPVKPKGRKVDLPGVLKSNKTAKAIKSEPIELTADQAAELFVKYQHHPVIINLIAYLEDKLKTFSKNRKNVEEEDNYSGKFRF